MADTEDDSKEYFINASLNIAKNFDIKFEYDVKDWEDIVRTGVSTPQGKSKYCGASRQLRF